MHKIYDDNSLYMNEMLSF